MDLGDGPRGPQPATGSRTCAAGAPPAPGKHDKRASGRRHGRRGTNGERARRAPLTPGFQSAKSSCRAGISIRPVSIPAANRSMAPPRHGRGGATSGAPGRAMCAQDGRDGRAGTATHRPGRDGLRDDTPRRAARLGAHSRHAPRSARFLGRSRWWRRAGPAARAAIDGRKGRGALRPVTGTSAPRCRTGARTRSTAPRHGSREATSPPVPPAPPAGRPRRASRPPPRPRPG